MKTNIKAARESTGKQQKECADAIGVTLRAWQGYEQGIREPKYETLRDIAKLFGVSTDYLLCMPNAKAPDDPFAKAGDDEKGVLNEYLTLPLSIRKEILDTMIKLAKKAQEIRESDSKSHTPLFVLHHYSLNKASAGVGYDLNDPDMWEDLTVVDTRSARDADFAVQVDGDSMDDGTDGCIKNGDIVFVKFSSEVPLGKVGIFRIGEKGYIKRCGKDRLISDNPEYNDIYPDDTPENIECIGIVLGTAELPE